MSIGLSAKKTFKLKVLFFLLFAFSVRRNGFCEVVRGCRYPLRQRMWRGISSRKSDNQTTGFLVVEQGGGGALLSQ